MRRLLLALTLLPATVFAQNALPTNPGMAGYGNAVPAGVRAYGQSGLANQPPVVQATTPNLQGKLRDEGKAFTPDTAQTAAEQGYTASTAKESAQALADYAALHTARQLGEQVRQPAPWNPVAQERSSQGWLANWSYTLDHAGVPDSKVKFEARRLSRTDFEAWANRQMITQQTCK